MAGSCWLDLSLAMCLVMSWFGWVELGVVFWDSFLGVVACFTHGFYLLVVF